MARLTPKRKSKGWLTTEGRWAIVLRYKDGVSEADIAKELEIAKVTVNRYVSLYRETGTVDSPPRKPRPLTRRHTTVSRSVRALSLLASTRCPCPHLHVA
eukprot:PhM_4_TR9518/c3_g2_i1/m.98163